MKAPTLTTLSLRDRFAALSSRERIFLMVGAGAVLLFLLYLLISRGEDGPVELAAAPPATVAPAPAPAPLPVVVAASPPVMSAAPASTLGLVLQGVSGGGPGGGAALFQYGAGNQRLVRIGREIVPGMMLKSLGPTFAIATSGGSDLRLDLGKAGATQVAAAVAPVAPAPAAGQVAERVETTELRIGLEPVQADGRVSGYRFRPGASLPRLEQAGLRPGDVITGVNGSTLDEERLMELSWSMSNSEATEFEFIRDGRKQKVALKPSVGR